MINFNKKNIFEKLPRTMLLFLYFFILLVTTFHHHPIDFADVRVLLSSAPTESSSHHLTSDECPIVNFAKNGFNTTFTFDTSTKIAFENEAPIECVRKFIPKKKLFSSLTRRGPPKFRI